MFITTLIVPMIIIALIVFLVSLVKNKSEIIEGDNDIMKNIYIYLVLFATLMMTIGGSVSVFMALADIVSPAPYY